MNREASTQSIEEKSEGKKSLTTLGWMLLGLLLSGIIIVAIFCTSASGTATVLLWMMACLLAGTAIGFLFGIPKILQGGKTDGATPVYQQQVNSNLTEISDWLTKIIVGLGLVNLAKIPPYLSKLSRVLAEGLCLSKESCPEMAFAFAYGTIVSYSIMGFLFGYIATRLYLARAFSEADQQALLLVEQRAKEAEGAAQSALHKAELALTKPSQQPDTVDGLNASQQLNALAASYNEIRATMKSGGLRTNRMTKVVSEMIGIIPALVDFDISQALNESDNGKRLSGYVYLYINPDFGRIQQLVDTFTSDTTPFGQYWGIQALGKVLSVRGDQQIDSNVMKKLKAFYGRLEKGVDREYELRVILPEILK